MKKLAFALLPLTLLVACQDSNTAAPHSAPSTFALAVLPDTQMYSRYNPAIYNAQTNWLVQNAGALNIPMTLHLGDVVDQVDKEAEWQAADHAMRLLEQAGLSYSVLAGNHDVEDDGLYDDKRPAGAYLKWFGPQRTGKQAGFVAADPTGYNTAYTFEAQGNHYLVLALDWRSSDASLQWAEGVIKAHPTWPTILTAHQIMNIGPDFVTAIDTDNGLRLWDKLIKNNDQIFLTINGHHHGAANMVKKNAFGHDVQMMVVDYQSDYDGGNGLMRLLEMDVAGGKMNVLSFSPWILHKDKAKLTQFDHAELKDANNAWTWNINFKERFAGFDPAFKVPSTSTNTSIVERVRQTLNTFKEVPAPGTPAKSAQDYPNVAGTLAHWRFVGAAGTAAGDIADLSGQGNTLHRRNQNGSPLEAITFSSSKPSLSAAQGSACQVSEYRDKGKPVSFWETDDTAPINQQTFAGGYTIEAFIKLDKGYNADKNRWMGVLTRNGDGHDIPDTYDYQDDPSEPLATLDVSNLRELHWAVATLQRPKPAVNELQTSWSWSMPVEQWVHVALVNDGKATSMFVDGAPVQRDALPTVVQQGIFSAGKNWIVGAKQSGGVARNGFGGCISEIRMVDHALKPSEFLTARQP